MNIAQQRISFIGTYLLFIFSVVLLHMETFLLTLLFDKDLSKSNSSVAFLIRLVVIAFKLYSMFIVYTKFVTFLKNS